jgi:hypothetical protein
MFYTKTGTMQNLMEMIAVEAAKGIGAGIRDFMKHSLTITALFFMLAGVSFACIRLLDVNTADRLEYKAEIKEYAAALNTANRVVMEVQSQVAMCIAERQKQAAEIIDLQFQMRQLKKTR